jgi:flagellar hook-basal body complex protein FliE
MPMIPPIDPGFSISSPEWGVGDVAPIEQPGATQPSQGFGGMLGNAISKLDETQTKAAGAAQSLVDGTATDPSSVVMQVERAQLAMQLASQIRTKATEAYTDVFHTQV